MTDDEARQRGAIYWHVYHREGEWFAPRIVHHGHVRGVAINTGDHTAAWVTMPVPIPADWTPIPTVAD